MRPEELAMLVNGLDLTEARAQELDAADASSIVRDRFPNILPHLCSERATPINIDENAGIEECVRVR
jgi:hypothetical protein